MYQYTCIHRDLFLPPSPPPWYTDRSLSSHIPHRDLHASRAPSPPVQLPHACIHPPQAHRQYSHISCSCPCLAYQSPAHSRRLHITLPTTTIQGGPQRRRSTRRQPFDTHTHTRAQEREREEGMKKRKSISEGEEEQEKEKEEKEEEYAGEEGKKRPLKKMKIVQRGANDEGGNDVVMSGDDNAALQGDDEKNAGRVVRMQTVDSESNVHICTCID